MPNKITQIIARMLLVAIVFTQVFGIYAFIKPQEPPKAQAIISSITSLSQAIGAGAELTSVPGVERFSWHTFLDDVFKQIMLGIAYSMSQQFMQRFVNKLTDKYKIRNFLYYDQVLTNYYLNNFLRDKISDPDLRQIYVLLESAYVTGQPTGTTPGTGPDPRKALIPRLKKAIADLYTDQTGIDPNFIANPPQNVDFGTYANQAAYFYGNHPGYTEVNLRRQFGEFQSAATTAAQLEVLVGNGLKAGRFIGGSCDILIVEESGTSGSLSTPQGCAAAGGTWQQSALDQARSFIDNPTAYLDKWMNGVVLELTGSNFDPNNFWFVIGNAFGRFLVNRLMIDKSNGVLNEDPRGYVPSDPNLGQGVNANVNGIDLDGDGLPDGTDIDGDGVMDNCYYGGTAPACTGSKTALGGGGGTAPGVPGGGSGPCAHVQGSPDYDSDLEDAINEVIAVNPGGIADAMNTTDNSEDFLNEVASVLQSRGFESTSEVLNGNGNDSSTNDIIAIWQSGDTLLERYDVIIGAGAGNTALRDAIGIQYTGDIPVDQCIK
jgi:hypothetical protein